MAECVYTCRLTCTAASFTEAMMDMLLRATVKFCFSDLSFHCFSHLKVLDALSANADTYFFTVPSLSDINSSITLTFSLLKTLVCMLTPSC